MVAYLLRARVGRVSALFSPQRVFREAFWTPPCDYCHRIRAASTSTSAVKTRRARAVTEKEVPPVEATATKTRKRASAKEVNATTSKTATTAKKKKKKTAKKAQPSDTDARIPPFKLAQLRDVAVLCGRNATGTKAALRTDLEEAVFDVAAHTTSKPAKPAKQKRRPQRILSIDMGVKNLAYCLLEVSSASAGADDGGPAKLVAWERLSLIDEDEARQAEATADTDTAATTTATKLSLFTPPRLAAVAARLVRTRLLALEPTHILIERQRSRSGGGMAVLEWTMRVNALEAMLHGIFAYHQVLSEDTQPAPAPAPAVQALQAVQDVEAVSPKRVSVFLLRGGIGNGTTRGLCPRPSSTSMAKKEKDIKDVKEAFLAGALRAAVEDKASSSRSKKTPKSTSLLTYADVASPMVEAYLLRWDTKQSRKKPKTTTTAKTKTKTKKAKAADKDAAEDARAAAAPPLPSLSKIDDLADCVAQGLIWLEWERNKAIFRERGAAALLEEKQLPG